MAEIRLGLRAKLRLSVIIRAVLWVSCVEQLLPVWLLSVNQSVVLILMQMCGIIISDGQCMMTTVSDSIRVWDYGSTLELYGCGTILLI